MSLETLMANKDETLKNFMLEHFCYKTLKKVGFYTTQKKKDYQSQADRICEFFGFKSVYEYAAMEIRAHVTYEGERPKVVNAAGELVPEPFVTEIKNIYKE